MTKSDLVSALRELGVRAGDRVLVHSSVAALGPVEGGAEAVIVALLEAVGPAGMIAVPTFDHESPYNRRTSATRLGVIPDLLWRRPDAVRSLHPTHSVAAIGEGAAEFIEGHEKAATAYAEGTPLPQAGDRRGQDPAAGG
jgi:aminoglycoside 3-N-acetyltransferase